MKVQTAIDWIAALTFGAAAYEFMFGDVQRAIYLVLSATFLREMVR